MSSLTATFTPIAQSGSTLALGHTTNRPRWVLPALSTILICAGVLLCWGVAGSEYSAFYASAARSMSESWKAFLVGSFSPANTITIDKILATVQAANYDGGAASTASATLYLRSHT